MRRALDLAQIGLGSVSPNPMVGAVIVHGENIIGEGYHQQFGGPHAEVNAINAVTDPALLSESTVYVSLEPCSHFGKTPPCADLLIEKDVRKVVVAALDPNPKVAGNGIIKLRSAGIEVETGVLEKESRILNQRFFINQQKQRPYIILKWAQTSDGFIARENYDSKWISDEYSRKLVHKWRSEEDGIMVGTNTAHYDNPELTVRDWDGRNPTRIVIDPNLRLDPGLKLFDRSVRTLCYNLEKESESDNLIFRKVSKDNFLREMIHDLLTMGVGSLLVEGGSQLLTSLIGDNLWDEARIFTSSALFENGIAAPVLSAEIISERMLIKDTLQIIYNSR